jgi:GDSL-like lipase/acylhydrolase family protein
MPKIGQTGQQKRRGVQSAAGNAAVLCISGLLGLVLAEGAIRVLYVKQLVLFPRYHTSAHYGEYTIRRLRPNMSFTHTSADGTFHFRTNNKGFRNDRDIEYAKSPGEIRVISLGDSHTQGYEVDQHQTFSAVAEKELNRRHIRATVINAGVSGFSTIEELIFLENEGYKYRPDYVVLGFYANDFVDNLRTQLMVLRNDSLVVKSHAYTPGVAIQDKLYRYAIFRFLGEHSYLYALAFNTVWNHLKNRSISAAKRAGASEERSEDEYAVGSTEALSEYDYALMAKVLARMYRFCRTHGIKLIIIDIPQFDMKSSIPPILLPKLTANSDTLYHVGQMRDEYSKLHKTHVQNGQRHISAETHALLGRKIAQYITADRLNRRTSR